MSPASKRLKYYDLRLAGSSRFCRVMSLPERSLIVFNLE